METPAGRILKGSDVRVQGQLRIETKHAGSRSPKEGCRASEPDVSIVKRHPDFALLEVTCSCGQKLYLRCEYAAGAEVNPSGAEAQANAPGTPKNGK
jgi:hypothetical protein